MDRLARLLPDPGDLTIKQAAQIARVHPNTIRNWLAEGLRGYRWGKGGRIMIRPAELARFLEEQRQV